MMMGYGDIRIRLAAQIAGKDQFKEFRTPEESVRSRATSLILMKDLTGQDFGYNAAAWRVWLEKNLDDLDESQTPAARRRQEDCQDHVADDAVKAPAPLASPDGQPLLKAADEAYVYKPHYQQRLRFTPEEQAWFNHWDVLDDAYDEERIQIAMRLLSQYEQWLHSPHTPEPMKAVYPPDPLAHLSPAEKRCLDCWRLWRDSYHEPLLYRSMFHEPAETPATGGVGA